MSSVALIALLVATFSRYSPVLDVRFSHLPEEMFALQGLRQACRQITMRINQTKPEPGLRILPRKVIKQRGYAGAGLPDDIEVHEAIRQVKAKRLRAVVVVAGAEHGDVVGVHSLILSVRTPRHRPGKAAPADMLIS